MYKKNIRKGWNWPYQLITKLSLNDPNHWLEYHNTTTSHPHSKLVRHLVKNGPYSLFWVVRKLIWDCAKSRMVFYGTLRLIQHVLCITHYSYKNNKGSLVEIFTQKVDIFMIFGRYVVLHIKILIKICLVFKNEKKSIWKYKFGSLNWSLVGKIELREGFVFLTNIRNMSETRMVSSMSKDAE